MYNYNMMYPPTHMHVGRSFHVCVAMELSCVCSFFFYFEGIPLTLVAEALTGMCLQEGGLFSQFTLIESIIYFIQ